MILGKGASRLNRKTTNQGKQNLWRGATVNKGVQGCADEEILEEEKRSVCVSTFATNLPGAVGRVKQQLWLPILKQI